MEKNSFYLILIIPLSILSACAAPTPQLVEVTRIVNQTVEVTRIVEVTSTPIPPTPTLAIPPTPTFALWTVQDAQAAITTADLEFVSPYPMTKDDYGPAPLSAQEAIRFLIPSLCADCGGRIYSFATQEDLDLMENYYTELGKQSALLFSWVFIKDNLLIQLNGNLPEAQALEYQAALTNITY
ncbi:MAG: hypothetical protein WA116_00915 [Anaerolineaceae bacterium]